MTLGNWLSFSSLLVKLSQVFESTLLDSILKLAVIPVAGAHFPTQFFLPVNFTFNMLWYSTPWTATPFSNDPLDLPSLWRVSMIGPLPSQQCSPLLWFQRTRETRNLYCMDGHLLKLKCKYLIFWDTDFWLSLAVSSNHQIVFYFTCNESKIYEFHFLK